MKKLLIIFFAFALAMSPFAALKMTEAAPVEMIVNGGFEDPIVGAPQLWDIYVTANIPGWKIEWMPSVPAVWNDVQRPAPQIELHRNVLGPAKEGEQYAELDTDWDGPAGSMNGEPASVRIFQDLPTVPGMQYELTFSYSPRPNKLAANNILEVWWAGSMATSTSRDGVGTTDWSDHSLTLTALSGVTRLAFEDHGAADSEGTFVDNISVKAIEVPVIPCEEGDDTVINRNSASVSNDVTAVADTGDNYAGGSYAGDGGRGGDIRIGGNANINNATTSAGGTGGDAGMGGTVISGNATSTVTVMNLINSSLTTIDRCACATSTTCDSGDVIIINKSKARLENDVRAIAKTGDNTAKGSYAGDGGSGGDIKVEPGGNANLNDVSTGEGGNGGTNIGGEGGTGGYVATGDAFSASRVVEIINRAVTRIMR